MRNLAGILVVAAFTALGTGKDVSASTQLANEYVTGPVAGEYTYSFDVVLTYHNTLAPKSHVATDPSIPTDAWNGHSIPDGIYFDQGVGALDDVSLSFIPTGAFASTPNVSFFPSLVSGLITLQYTGTTTYGPTVGNPETLGTFSFESTFPVPTTLVQYSDFDNAATGDDNPEYVVAPVGVPEPSTLILLAVGLNGFLGLRRGRRRAIC